MPSKPKSKQSVKPEVELYNIAPPSPVELAQIAALVGPIDEPEEALRNGMRLYLLATVFCKKYQDARPRDKADMTNADRETKLRLFKAEWIDARREDKLPVLISEMDVPPFPLTRNDDNATFDDFMKLVVTIKKKDDAISSLRHFFDSESPEEKGALVHGGEQIAKHKKDGFTPCEWNNIAARYLLWKLNTKSKTCRDSRKKK